MSTIDPAAVQQLLDRQAVVDVLTRYSRLLDAGDIEGLVTQVFAPDAIDNHGEGDVQGTDALRAWFTEVRSNFSGCRHTFSNVVVDLDGDTARTRCTLTAWVWVKAKSDGNPLRPADYVIVLDYVDRLRRTADGWRIERRDLIPNEESMVGVGHVPGTQKGLLALAERARSGEFQQP